MKILAGRRDEVMKRKAEYDAKRADYDDEMERRSQKRYRDEQELMEPVKDQIENDLAQFDLLEFDVRVTRGWSWNRKTDDEHDFLEIRIRCNEDIKFEDKSALSWSYEVGLDKDGEVNTETSSWSGLKGTTPEQLDSLRQTIEALELLNSYDWGELIKVKFKDYHEYYEGAPEAPERFNYTEELNIATLEDAADNPDEVIKVYGWSEEYPGWYWVKINGMTEKQVKMSIVSDYIINGLQRFIDNGGVQPEGTYYTVDNYIEQAEEALRGEWSVRAKKVNVHPYDPVETVNIRELIDKARALNEKVKSEQE